VNVEDIVFLDVDEVIELHASQLELFGGGAGLRDQGLLESAVAQPQASFGGHLAHDGLFAMAAAYLFHLVSNHPFVDGNKRIALTAAEVFLLLNGHRLKATNVELERLTMGVADGSLSKDAVTEFIRAHVVLSKRR